MQKGGEYKILRALLERGTYKKIKNLYYEDHARKFVTGHSTEWVNYRSDFLADFNDTILNEFECLRDDSAYHHLWIRKN